MRPGPLLSLLAVALLGACSAAPTGASGPIVVPPPAADPTSIAPQPNTLHVHALATAGHGAPLLVGSHRGAFVMGLGGPAAGPTPSPAVTLAGDVLQVVVGLDGAMYACGHSLGIRVSRDRGVTWAVASPDTRGYDVHGLAADPRDPHQMYAYAVGVGLLVSSDAGQHWTHRAGQADKGGIFLAGLAVTADGTLLAGSPQLGLAASTDHGSTFVSVYKGSGRVYALAASATNADELLVAGESGVFLTLDGGKDWSQAETSITVTGVGIDPGNPDRFFAGTTDGSLYTSADAGNTWSPI